MPRTKLCFAATVDLCATARCCPAFIFYNHALSVIELNRNLNAAIREKAKEEH